MHRRHIRAILLTVSIMLSLPVLTQEVRSAGGILIENVVVFDGKSDKLSPVTSVLVEGNTIVEIGRSIPAPADATVIAGGGRTLAPGFIDAHVHLQWNTGAYTFFDSPPDYHAALALVEAKNTLMRGFTSVRDTGGAVFGVKRAIDEGHQIGPRIYASGAAIGMTPVEQLGISVFADGVPEVLTASRDQMRRGAHFLKMFVGGAVSGLRDPLDVAEYSVEEIKAAADEAGRWNTYLAVHAYTDRSVREALEAGAMFIEHANLITEETIELAAVKGAFISAQTVFVMGPPPERFLPAQKQRQKQSSE